MKEIHRQGRFGEKKSMAPSMAAVCRLASCDSKIWETGGWTTGKFDIISYWQQNRLQETSAWWVRVWEVITLPLYPTRNTKKVAGKNCRIQLHFHLIILIRQAIRAVRSRKKTFGLNCSVRPVAGSSLIQFKDLAGKNCCILISKTQLGERVREIIHLPVSFWWARGRDHSFTTVVGQRQQSWQEKFALLGHFNSRSHIKGMARTAVCRAIKSIPFLRLRK